MTSTCKMLLQAAKKITIADHGLRRGYLKKCIVCVEQGDGNQTEKLLPDSFITFIALWLNICKPGYSLHLSGSSSLFQNSAFGLDFQLLPWDLSKDNTRNYSFEPYIDILANARQYKTSNCF